MRALACYQQPPDEESAVGLMSVLTHALNQPLPSGRQSQNMTCARIAILAEAVRLSQFLESKPLLSVALSKARPRSCAAVCSQDFGCETSAQPLRGGNS